MSNEHFIIISLKKLNSLKKLVLITDNGNGKFPNENEVCIDIGKSVNINFLDFDVLNISSDLVDVRIDMDISFLERSIKKFRDESDAKSN